MKIRNKRLVVYNLQLSVLGLRCGFVSGVCAVDTARQYTSAELN